MTPAETPTESEVCARCGYPVAHHPGIHPFTSQVVCPAYVAPKEAGK